MSRQKDREGARGAPTSAQATVQIEPLRFELYCATCGYGVVVRMAPSSCPMCQSGVWEHAESTWAAKA